MPDDEKHFVVAVNKVRTAAAGLQDRRQLERLQTGLCETSLNMSDWTGLIANSFNSPSGMKRVILVKISPHITVRTAFADDQAKTLVAQGSALYPAVAALAPGDPVQFSGRFVTVSRLRESTRCAR